MGIQSIGGLLMRSHYNCSECKKIFPATEEYFFPSNLKMTSQRLQRTTIPKCKECAKQYSSQYRKSLKDKGLVRSQRTTSFMAGAVNGTVYVIGPHISGTPYKIGITSGTKTDRRKSALQTSHWLELKEVWKSTLLDRADIVEKKLHKHFENKRVRGEWFNLDQQDLDSIPGLIENFGTKI
jgi:hypothetical protein